MGIVKQPETNALLTLFNNGKLTDFLHSCVDDLTQNRRIQLEQFSSEPESIANNHKAVVFIQDLYSKWSINKTDNKCPDLPKPVEKSILDCYDLRKDDIFQTLMRSLCLKSGPSNLVNNFDYKLKWIMGSSKLSSLRLPLLQLDFYCSEEDSMSGSVKNTVVSTEADMEHVDNLIGVLEKAILDLKSDESG